MLEKLNEFDYLDIYTANHNSHALPVSISPWKHSRSTNLLRDRIIKHTKMIKIINQLIKMNDPDAEEVKMYVI